MTSQGNGSGRDRTGMANEVVVAVEGREETDEGRGGGDIGRRWDSM